MPQPLDNRSPASRSSDAGAGDVHALAAAIEVTPPESSRAAWLLSAGLHAAALIAAVFIIPFGELTAGPRRSARTASAEQVRHVTDQIRAAQELEVRANLERVAEIEEEMRQLLEPKLGYYSEMERRMRETALADALSAQEETLARQRETLEFIRRVKADPIGEYGRGADANRTQGEADAAQERAARATGLLEDTFAAAAEAQRAASDLQAAAGKALVDANNERFVNVQRRLSELSEDGNRQRADQRFINDRAKQEKEWPAELQKHEEMLAAREAKLAAAEAAITEAQTKVTEAQAAAGTATQAADRTPDADKEAKQTAKREASAANEAQRQAEGRLRQARDAASAAKREVDWSRGEVRGQSEPLARLRQELGTRREQMAARERSMARAPPGGRGRCSCAGGAVGRPREAGRGAGGPGEGARDPEGSRGVAAPADSHDLGGTAAGDGAARGG